MDKIKKFIKLTGIVLVFSVFVLSGFVFAKSNKRLVDEASLLTTLQRESLNENLDSLSEKNKIDFVILIIESLGNKSARDYADDYFDDNAYGYNESKDGILFLLSTKDREYHISTSGKVIKIFYDDYLEHMEELIIPYLKDRDYEAAFNKFINLSIKAIDEYELYQKELAIKKEKKKKFFQLKTVGISLLSGFLLAAVFTLYRARELRAMPKNNIKNNYLLKNNINVGAIKETFLYRKVKIIPKLKPDMSTSVRKSTTYSSASGRIHGGRGGKF